MKCRLCDDIGLKIKLDDGSTIYECLGDTEQVEGLATLIADRSYTGFAHVGPDLHTKIYNVALNAIRKANR